MPTDRTTATSDANAERASQPGASSSAATQDKYDAMYFDSDEEDGDDAAAAAAKTSRKKMTDDDLFYDPDADDDDQRWVDGLRMSYSGSGGDTKTTAARQQGGNSIDLGPLFRLLFEPIF